LNGHSGEYSNENSREHSSKNFEKNSGENFKENSGKYAKDNSRSKEHSTEYSKLCRERSALSSVRCGETLSRPPIHRSNMIRPQEG
jgi:hypothetical protein